MGGGLESRCVGRVYCADGAARHHSLAVNITSMTNTSCCEYSIKAHDGGQ